VMVDTIHSSLGSILVGLVRERYRLPPFSTDLYLCLVDDIIFKLIPHESLL
jgi:hypothetical protein